LALVLSGSIFSVEKAAGDGFDDKRTEGHVGDHIVHRENDVFGLSVDCLIGERSNLISVFEGPTVLE
jgi:hypothetical protein